MNTMQASNYISNPDLYPELNYNCTLGAGAQGLTNGGGGVAQLRLALKDTTTQPIYNAASHWSTGYSIFGYLTENDSLLAADTSLANFYTTTKATNIGKLYRATEAPTNAIVDWITPDGTFRGLDIDYCARTSGACTLRVTLPGNCTFERFFSVTVNAPPVPVVLGDITLNCGDGSQNYTVDNVAAFPVGTTFKWYLNAVLQTPTSSTFSHDWGISSAGGQVCVEAVYPCTSACVSSQGCLDVVVAPMQIAVSATNETCSLSNGTATVSVTAVGTSPYTYLWDDAGTQTTATATGLPAGTYSIIVTDDNGCTATDNAVLVNNFPLANAGPDQYICTGSAQLNGTGAGPGGSYSWNNGGSLSSTTIANPVATPTTTTTYTLSVTDALNTCTTTDDVTVTILSGSDCPDFLYHKCHAFLACDVFSGMSFTQFQVEVTKHTSTNTTCGGYVSTTSSTVRGTTTLQHCTDEWWNSNTPGYDSGIMGLLDNHINLSFIDNLVSPPNYYGLPQGGDLSGFFVDGRDYTFKLLVGSGGILTQYGDGDCVTTQPSPTICGGPPNTKLENLENNSTTKKDFIFEVFPNPASQYLQIRVEGLAGAGKLELRDVLGRPVSKQSLAADQSQTAIDISTYSEGMYFCKLISTDNVISVRRIVVEK